MGLVMVVIVWVLLIFVLLDMFRIWMGIWVVFFLFGDRYYRVLRYLMFGWILWMGFGDG